MAQVSAVSRIIEASIIIIIVVNWHVWNTILGIVPASGHLYYNHLIIIIGTNKRWKIFPTNTIVGASNRVFVDRPRCKELNKQQAFNATMDPNLMSTWALKRDTWK